MCSFRLRTATNDEAGDWYSRNTDTRGLAAGGVLIGTVELWDCTGDGECYEWHVRRPERASELLKPAKHPQPAWFNPF